MRDVYATITDRVIAALEKGVVPWHQPWDSRQGPPRNLVSGTVYRGMNVWMLAGQGMSPYWLTFRQAKQIGGSVKKGERGTAVIFWKWVAKKGEAVDEAQEVEDKPGRGMVPIVRSYTVFNACQCELPEKWRGRAEIKPPELDDAQKIQAAEDIAANMPDRPELIHAGARAFYRPRADRVTMPEPSRFESPELYYSTLFHELTHSTGHERRRSRKTLADALGFGDTNYSKEELCAEMGAAFLCGVAGIDNKTCDGSARYINGWLKKLAGDKKLLIQAAAQAQKAADFILGKSCADDK